jgi:hypothetical protein
VVIVFATVQFNRIRATEPLVSSEPGVDSLTSRGLWFSNARAMELNASGAQGRLRIDRNWQRRMACAGGKTSRILGRTDFLGGFGLCFCMYLIVGVDRARRESARCVARPMNAAL